MDFKILLAEIKDHNRLSEIAFAAKAYWNYPPEYLVLWKNDLTIKPSYMATRHVLKLQNSAGKIIGFTALELTQKTMDINHFWIDPKYIGKAFGRKLIEEVFSFAQSNAINKITLTADPNAASFYEKFGFSRVGEVESLPKGRFLPEMEKIV